MHVALGCTLEENLDSIAESVRAAVASGREAMVDCEHFFDGYKANPKYALACAKTSIDAGARWAVLCDTNGGTLPHEIERIVGGGRARHSRRPSRHPRPQRHRQRGRQFARRDPRRRAAGAGHAERPRRALRQRQSRDPDPDAGAEGRVRRALRNRRQPEVAAPDHPDLARLRRAAQPLAEPPRALCRRVRLRHQGRHSCLGARQGPAHLRARDAGERRQQARHSHLRPGRDARTSSPSSTGSGSRPIRTIRA